ncbi:MAG: DUF3696 domain-containing protein [Rhodobacterales bacterium]|nr:DUF3696 domain-containing protein [Rhodobacterales bacterium]
MVHNHDLERTLGWSLEFLPDQEITLKALGQTAPITFQGNRISIESGVRFENRTESSKPTMLRYRLSNKSGNSIEFSLSPKEKQSKDFNLDSEFEGFRFVRTTGRAWQLPGPTKSYAFPDQARTYYQNASFLSDLESAYEEQVDKIFYLGPLREYPARDYLWARSRPTDVGNKGEKTIDAILAMTVAGETRNTKFKAKLRPFQEIIAYWLKEIGVIDSFQVDEIAPGSNRWQAKVRIRKNGTEVLLTDVGFGVSQVLPVVTLLQFVPEGSTVILEQPEIHLHPLAQANLADAIINAAVHRRVQVIFESHSEHLLLRLQRRIAEGALDSLGEAPVQLYFCDWKRNSSCIEPLILSKTGTIQNWPENFMGDAFGETLAAQKARLGGSGAGH